MTESADFNNTLRWQDTQANALPQIPATGTPFIIMGGRTMECQNGPERHGKAKAELRASIANDVSQIVAAVFKFLL